MVTQTITRWITLPASPAALMWAEMPATPALRAAARSFGFADDEADLEQALAACREIAWCGSAAAAVAPNDFERLYGFFLA